MFSYDSWDRLLADIVNADGKVDYDRLMERRSTLDGFIAGENGEIGWLDAPGEPEGSDYEAMLSNVRVNREIMAAWGEHCGADVGD